MVVYEGCRMWLRGEDGAPLFEDDDVEVKQEGERLEVVYWDDEGPLVFAGHVTEQGHYELVCRSRPRKATLAWSSDRRLEGTWREGDDEGSWTIVVASDA